MPIALEILLKTPAALCLNAVATCVILPTAVPRNDGGRLLVGKELRCESDLDTQAEYLQQGTVIFFPSWYEHKVTQITRGTRYSFTIWLLGPPWK